MLHANANGPVSAFFSPHPLVLAHRGGARLRPENTMAAFSHAAALGVDAIELDVRLARDGEVMVIHDETLDRTTDARGFVVDRTARELAEVDAGWAFEVDGAHPYRGRGIAISRLADVLAAFPALVFVVELKGESAALAAQTVDVLRRAEAADRVAIGGFHPVTMGEARRRAPELVTSASTPEVRRALYRSYVGLAPKPSGYRLFQVPESRHGRRVVSRRFVRAAARARVPVHVWTVNDPADMRRLIAWGVTGLITDRPDIAREVVRQTAGAGL